MAAAADEISLSALAGRIDRPGVVVADVGSGESTSLGMALTSRNPTLTYVPIDIRPSALDAHRVQGFGGRVGSATALPFSDGSVDVIHARFVFAWLDPGSRGRAIEELVRVMSGDAPRAVVIDYDWGSAAGPDAVVAWKDRLLDMLSAFGFDPTFGQRLADDTSRRLSEVGLDTSDYSLRETRVVTTQPMRQALATIAVLAESVTDRLVSLGLDDEAEELDRLHATVVDHGRRHPETVLSLPTVVATTVDFRGAGVTSVARTIGWRRTSRRRTDPSGLPHAGPAELGVHRLESDDLVAAARRLQAAEYVNHGYVTEDAVDGDGFFIAEIDPPDVVARSTYLGVIDDDGDLAGCIRMIRPASGDLTTLPILDKLLSARAATDPGPADLPFPDGSVIFEASGLARSTRLPDPVLTTRLLLAVACEARRCGDDFGIMGIVENIAGLLAAVYGKQAIRSLQPTMGTVTLTGNGIRPRGVVLIPCYAEIDTFVTDCLEHCLQTPDREYSRLNRPLIELTAAALAR